ncbi:MULTISPECIES: L,D-transpeptidase family protein [unclassified Aureimonas]|uniref:L,D-transpeptidase family protein n=1 Tax=unclassified Aureimonas TaxID=2615206 RepID=UPI000700CE94|nr:MULTISPECIES: L,D-transpeptidase [unclassified Aureimonas]KQT54025.1 ATP synthase [Aureimonas sp. Leaf427]KQT71535.1 ATP synthase [Aureimonas sp. Leaf460]
MKSAMLAFLALSAAGAPAFAAADAPASARAEKVGVASSPEAGVRLAQFYDPEVDPFYDNGRGTQTFVDEFGRTVTVDGQGRIISVERPRRRPSQSRDPVVLNDPRRSGDEIILEGPVGGGRLPRSADPYEDYPIEASPLPDPLYDDAYPQSGRSAGLPGETSPGGLPADRGSAPIFPGETTAPESRPAPSVVGPKGKNASVQIAALQVLLDRAGISPGVIDGRMGSNVDKAVAAYEEKFGLRIDATDSQALAEQLDETGGPAVVSYTITDKDLVGPYLASIPEDYAEKAKLPAMSYTRVTEMLGERFHMDEDYLKTINPGADFNRPGTIIKVMAVGENVKEPVARIIADKGREQVRAYDAAGRLVAAYPSTIGSSDTPSPSGTVEVSRIAFDPNYTYNPKINFTQGQNKSILTIPPGPNGPVGTIWIALSKPTYGIHGTPEPSKIGKTNSHGCVRLANFDAQELAKLVKPGVTVEFIE